MACPLAPVFLWLFMDGSSLEVFHGYAIAQKPGLCLSVFKVWEFVWYG
jgi:hypothetical protein